MANVAHEVQTNDAAGEARVDMKFEIVVIPVSDVDRAREFYGRLGWRLDADYDNGKDFRVTQFTPPGSGCSVIFGKNVTGAAPWCQPPAAAGARRHPRHIDIGPPVPWQTSEPVEFVARSSAHEEGLPTIHAPGASYVVVQRALPHSTTWRDPAPIPCRDALPDPQATRFPCAPHHTGPSSHRPHSSAHPESAPPPDKRPPASPEIHFPSRHVWSGESKPPSRVVFQCDAWIDSIIAQSELRLKEKLVVWIPQCRRENAINSESLCNTFPKQPIHTN